MDGLTPAVEFQPLAHQELESVPALLKKAQSFDRVAGGAHTPLRDILFSVSENLRHVLLDLFPNLDGKTVTDALEAMQGTYSARRVKSFAQELTTVAMHSSQVGFVDEAELTQFSAEENLFLRSVSGLKEYEDIVEQSPAVNPALFSLGLAVSTLFVVAQSYAVAIYLGVMLVAGSISTQSREKRYYKNLATKVRAGVEAFKAKFNRRAQVVETLSKF